MGREREGWPYILLDALSDLCRSRNDDHRMWVGMQKNKFQDVFVNTKLNYFVFHIWVQLRILGQQMDRSDKHSRMSSAYYCLNYNLLGPTMTSLPALMALKGCIWVVKKFLTSKISAFNIASGYNLALFVMSNPQICWITCIYPVVIYSNHLTMACGRYSFSNAKCR